MVVLLLGQQGTGKSTLGRSLGRHLGGSFISGGELIRDEIDRRSITGRMLDTRIARGDRARPRTVYRLLKRALKQHDPPYFVDGFPGQASEAGLLARTLPQRPTVALLLEGPSTEQLVFRLLHRIECTSCRTPYGPGAPPPETGRCICGGQLKARPEDSDHERITKRHRFWSQHRDGLLTLCRDLTVLRTIDTRQAPAEALSDAIHILETDGLKRKSS
jgi:adenylate kinase family enzyme